MSYGQPIRIVRVSQKYQGALDKDISISHTLENTTRDLLEAERNAVVNLNEQYFLEKEECTLYRPYGKISPLVDNTISGTVTDSKMLGFWTYYYPPAPLSTATEADGYPSISFFDFFTPTGMTTVHGYAEPTSYKGNWKIYESYVVSGNSFVEMEYYTNLPTDDGIAFVSGDGIPFSVSGVTINGKEALQFICPVDHGLLDGEYILLQDRPTINLIGAVNQITQINGSELVPVFSFGSEHYGTENKVFNVILREPTAGWTDGDVGVFKRLSDPNNSAETTSRYYVHTHELLSNTDESVVDRAAFELGVYTKRQRYYREDQSPPFGSGHTVVKNQTESYLFNFNKDLDIGGYLDNLNRPLSNIYITILAANEPRLWRSSSSVNSNVTTAGIGWSWNFIPNGSIDPYPLNNYEQLLTPNVIPQKGDKFLGAFVEYNEFELRERVVSEVFHRLTFNNNLINSGGTGDVIQEGYYYQPHYTVPIRKFSNSIVTYKDYRFVPPYATFSEYDNLWRWRSLLEIGFFDERDNGVDYPFVNGHHYTYKNINFFIKPDVNKSALTDEIIGPLSVDDCE